MAGKEGSSQQPEIKKLGMMGAGSMGGMMSLMLAEYGTEVHFFDPSDDNCKTLIEHAKTSNLQDKLFRETDYGTLCSKLKTNDSPRYFIFSLPHGKVCDKTVEGLEPHLSNGDIIIDASNEWYENTERRQKKLEPKGIHYLGVGVSGGYQSARHGPSFSPGGNKEALDIVMPFLERIAAKDLNGRPCVNEVGPGGSGHYVKMVHNGIEQGMMSTLCEVWGIMTTGLGMTYPEIGDVFSHWVSKDSELYDNFLVGIGADICRTKDDKGEFVLAKVRDKVVQDVDETEGTGTWTCLEGVRLHVPHPTISTAHLFRCSTADLAHRLAVHKAFTSSSSDHYPTPSKIDLGSKSKEDFILDLRLATYASFLLSFAQGLLIIKRKAAESNWNLNFPDILQLWRGGCIIQSDHITDLLEKVYKDGAHEDDDILSSPEVGKELARVSKSYKNVIMRSLESDLVIPSLSAGWEFYKYSGQKELPTQFMEAELDYFGEHMFDLKSELPGKPETGKHHYEWKPAKGITEDWKSPERKD